MRWLTLIVLFAVAATSRGQDPKAVVERAIKMHGGADALAKTKALTQSAKGRINQAGADVEATREAKLALPDRAYWAFEIASGGAKVNVRICVSGLRGWQSAAGLPALDLGTSEYDTVAEEMHVAWLCSVLPLTSKELTLKAMPDAEVGKQPVHVISVAKPDRSDVLLHFNKETGLLVKSAFRGKAGGKVATYESVMEEHKPFAGVRLPTKITDFKDGTRMGTWTVTDVKFVDKFEADAFKKP